MKKCIKPKKKKNNNNVEALLPTLFITQTYDIPFFIFFPVLAELWPIMDRCAVISKKEIFYIWPFGLASWLWGTIFIDRLNAEKAQESINKTGKVIKDRKVSHRKSRPSQCQGCTIYPIKKMYIATSPRRFK